MNEKKQLIKSKLQKKDSDRVVFHSKEDMSSGLYLQKAEHILRGENNINNSNVNDILELYNIKKYIDNEVYLLSWKQDDIESFKIKVSEYEKLIGKFISSINKDNFEVIC